MKFQEHLSQHVSESCKLVQTSKIEYLEYYEQHKLIFTVFLFIYLFIYFLTKMSLIKSIELTAYYLICPLMQLQIYKYKAKRKISF